MNLTRNEIKEAVIEYNKGFKIKLGLFKILSAALILALIIMVVFDLAEGTVVGEVTSYIKFHIASASAFGLFLTGIIGGLFFITFPLEIAYIAAISTTSTPWFYFLVMITGLSISYSFNYLAGLLLSKSATNIVSAKQFYAIKSKLNIYGKWIIFIFNVLPLPSQPLMFICGVFRYNKIRLATIWILAWVIKLAILTQFTHSITTTFGI